MKVRLLTYTPEPEKLVATAARLCYSGASDIDSLMSGLTNTSTKQLVQQLTKLGHYSPFEHVTFTFAIEGVSRALLAQITRHRLASFSVQSQRYCNMEDSDHVRLIDCDVVSEDMYEDAISHATKAYKALLARGIKKEDARLVLPEATHTRMIVTMNARELIHFFSLRCCNRAQWEIQAVATEMYRLAYEVAPGLFATAGPGCVDGRCPEGAMCCGKSDEMKELFTILRA